MQMNSDLGTFIVQSPIVSWEPEGHCHYSKMFCWEPEWHYCCTMSMVIAPFSGSQGNMVEQHPRPSGSQPRYDDHEMNSKYYEPHSSFISEF